MLFHCRCPASELLPASGTGLYLLHLAAALAHKVPVVALHYFHGGPHVLQADGALRARQVWGAGGGQQVKVGLDIL